MRVRFWGTRGTRPTPGRRTLRYGGNTTCIEVRSSDDELLVIDSGSGIAELGAKLAPLGPTNVNLLITHTHWDHIQGFPFFAPAFIPGTKLTLVGPAGSIKSLKAAFADQMDLAYFPLRLDQVPAEIEFIERDAGETFEVAGLRVTPHELNHPILTFGYRIEEGDQSLVFATDNELVLGSAETDPGFPTPSREDLVQWCEGADLLVHDAQYSRDEYDSHVGWGHTSYAEALSLADHCGAAQLAFFHHDPMHSDADIDALVDEALITHREAGGRRLAAFPATEDQEIQL